MGQGDVLDLLEKLYEKDPERTYSVEEIAKLLGKATTSVGRCLKRLVESGEICRVVKHYNDIHLHSRYEYRALSPEEKKIRDY